MNWSKLISEYYVIVHHCTSRHLENKICQTSHAFFPSLCPLRTLVSQKKRDIWERSRLEAIGQGAGNDQVVDISAAEAGELLENSQGCYRNGRENRENKHKVEEEQPIGQNQIPKCITRPPDRYGEWNLNSLQQITESLKVVGDM